MPKWFLLPCLAGLAAAQSAVAQVQPTFRVGTRLVQVDVVVRTDKAAVRGLTKDDFTVQDKGKTQKIAVFAVTDKADPSPKGPVLPSNVASNRMNNRGETSRSATVILFDRLNTTDAADQANARRNILALLSSLKPADKVAFYSLYDKISVVQEFMDSADQLAQAATRLSSQGAGGAGGAAADPLETALREALDPAQPIDSPSRVQITAAAFRSIARRLEGVPGRKSLLWITSSVPLTYGSGAERRSNDEAEVANYARILSEANVALYPVDPRGAGSSFSQATTDRPTEGALMPGAGRGSVNQVANQSLSSLSGTQGMQEIADQTGGKAFLNVNDISIPLHEVLDFSGTAYTLGFYVDDKALDGKVHSLSVKVAKKPETSGAKVYARKSYLAVSATSPVARQERAGMTELDAEQLDATAIGVMAATAPDPSKPGIHAVQVRVTPSDLQFEHRGDKWAASFDLGLSIEVGGHPSNVNVKTINVDLTDAQLKQAFAGGLDIVNTVPTPAQPSRLRVVVQDKVSGAAGSVRIPIGPK